jgi:hypothetical protein
LARVTCSALLLRTRNMSDAGEDDPGLLAVRLQDEAEEDRLRALESEIAAIRASRASRAHAVRNLRPNPDIPARPRPPSVKAWNWMVLAIYSELLRNDPEPTFRDQLAAAAGATRRSLKAKLSSMRSQPDPLIVEPIPGASALLTEHGRNVAARELRKAGWAVP